VWCGAILSPVYGPWRIEGNEEKMWCIVLFPKRLCYIFLLTMPLVQRGCVVYFDHSVCLSVPCLPLSPIKTKQKLTWNFIQFIDCPWNCIMLMKEMCHSFQIKGHTNFILGGSTLSCWRIKLHRQRRWLAVLGKLTKQKVKGQGQNVDLSLFVFYLFVPSWLIDQE